MAAIKDPEQRPGQVGAYTAVIGARYRMLLQYRAAALAGLVTQMFWGAIRIMVMTAFYRAASADTPMSLADVITYIWLGQALLGMLPWNIDNEIAEQIRHGSVAYELTRPIDLYGYWFCRTIALRTATTTLRCIPMVLVAMLILPRTGLESWAMRAPDGVASFILFVLSMGMALAIACAVTMLMHVVLVVSLSGDGLNRIMPSLVLLFSGMLIPLPLFPDWLQPFLSLQPLRGIVDVPYRIYLGHIAPPQAVPEILQQALWALVLMVLGRWLLRRALRRLVVQGG